MFSDKLDDQDTAMIVGNPNTGKSVSVMREDALMYAKAHPVELQLFVKTWKGFDLMEIDLQEIIG